MRKLIGLAFGSVLMAASLPMFASMPAPVPVTAMWKVTGNVQGVPVNLSCSLTTAADLTVGGACVDDQSKSHAVTGTVKDQTVTWQFASEYEGSPITVTMVGVVDTTGTKMVGTIVVDPMNADGDFTAVVQVPPATT